MNTWSYLILIVALFIVAALMLYARFASRSREKSLHHAPAEKAAVESEWENSIAETSEEIEEALEEVTLEQEEEGFIVKIEKREEEKEPVQKSEYFDELQEAAAGLAMLMRSSPVSDRATPVVFAPEEEELIAIEKIENPGQDSVEADFSEAIVDEGDAPSPDSASPDHQETEGLVSDLGEEPVVAEAELSSPDSDIVEPAEAVAESREDEEIVSIVDLLGEEVNDQILHLDFGLDALEELVASIEVSLAELGPFESEIGSAEESGSEAMAVEVAA